MSMSSPTLLELLDRSVWMNCLRLLIAANTIGSNSFLLALFLRFKQLRQSQCNRLIMLNAVMDLLSGFGPLVRALFQLYLLQVHVDHFSKMPCILVSIPYSVGFCCSQITFLGLAFDRLMAIASPVAYKSKNQYFFHLITFLALFFGSMSLAMLLVGNDLSAPSSQCSVASNAGPYFSDFWTYFMGISTILVFGIYLALLCLYFRHRSTVSATNSSYQAQGKANDLSLTRTIALILAIYMVAWAIPTAIWFAFNLADPSDKLRMNYVSYVQGYVTAAGCGLNLYIYLYKHAEIRQCARNVVGKTKGMAAAKGVAMATVSGRPKSVGKNTVKGREGGRGSTVRGGGGANTVRGGGSAVAELAQVCG